MTFLEETNLSKSQLKVLLSDNELKRKSNLSKNITKQKNSQIPKISKAKKVP